MLLASTTTWLIMIEEKMTRYHVVKRLVIEAPVLHISNRLPVTAYVIADAFARRTSREFDMQGDLQEPLKLHF